MYKAKRLTLVITLILVATIFTGCTFIEGIFGGGSGGIRVNPATTTRVIFNEGEIFDLNTVQVQFSSNNNTNWQTADVSRITFHPSGPLVFGTTQIVITYRGTYQFSHSIVVHRDGQIEDCPPDCTLPCCETPYAGEPLVAITITPPQTTTWVVDSIPPGHARTFTYTRHPSDSTAAITWHSSNPEFATVIAFGNSATINLIDVNTPGYTDITARSGAISSAPVRIRVDPAPIPGGPASAIATVPNTTQHWVFGVEHNARAGRRVFTRNLTPANATNAGIEWHSTNPSVASINAHGEVTLVGAGYTYINSRIVGGISSTPVRVNVTRPGYNAQGQQVVAPSTGPDNRARGVGYSFNTSPSVAIPGDTSLTMQLMTDGDNPISWFYGWNTRPGDGPYRTAAQADEITNRVTNAANAANVAYVPMHWGGNGMSVATMTRIREWVVAQRNAGHAVTYLRALNEVNISGQGAILPLNFLNAQNGWVNILAIARELDLHIIAPTAAQGNVTGALNPGGRYGGWDGGRNWLVDFFVAIRDRNNPARYGSIYDIRAIPVNTYISHAGTVKSFIENIHNGVFNAVGLRVPMWITEWAAWYWPVANFLGSGSGYPRMHVAGGPRSVEELRRWQAWHMSQLIAFFEQNPAIEKYAWYHVRHRDPTPDDRIYRSRPNPGGGSSVRHDVVPAIGLITRPEAPGPVRLTDIGIIYTNASVFDPNYRINVNRGRFSAAALISRNCVSYHTRAMELGTIYGFRESVNFWPLTGETEDNQVGALEVRDLGRYAGGGGQNRWIEFNIVVPAGQGGNFRLDIRNRKNTGATSAAIISIDGRTFNQTFPAINSWNTVGVDIGHLAPGHHTLRITGTTPLNRNSTVSGGQVPQDNNLSLNWLEFVRV